MTDIEIKFKLKIAKGKEIELTEMEARQLYNKLDSMFGEKQGWIFPSYPQCPQPLNPYYTSTPPDYTVYPIITCQVDGKDYPILCENPDKPIQTITHPVYDGPELKSTTTTSHDLTDIKSVDWSYIGGFTQGDIINEN